MDDEPYNPIYDEIVFHMKGHLEGNAKETSWEYADSTDRDAALALVDNTVGAVVA